MTALFFLDNITGATLRMMTPLLLVALGELYSERAGLTNIGLDGIMSIGTIAGFLGGCLTGSPWMGLLLGALCGVALNMIYAFCTITLRAGQIINGMALNILGPALVTYLYRRYFGVTDTLISVNLMPYFWQSSADLSPFPSPAFSDTKNLSPRKIQSSCPITAFI